MTVSRTRDLAELGRTPAELDRLNRSGDLVRIRHGAYADESATTALDLHRQLVAGTAPILDPAFSVYSHPLPHVLILTAIVVGVATLALGLALVVRINEAYGTIEEDEIFSKVEEDDT